MRRWLILCGMTMALSHHLAGETLRYGWDSTSVFVAEHPGGVDLSVSPEGLSYWPENPKDGGWVKLYAKVDNNSDIDIFNIKVAFTDNAYGLLPILVPIDTVNVYRIPADSSATAMAFWFPVGQVGDNNIIVEVDPENEIEETNEENNLAILPIFLLPPSEEGEWVDITGNLPNTWVNAIAPHPFFSDSLYIGTAGGAFQTTNGGSNWSRVNFGENVEVEISQIQAVPNPWVDCLCAVIYLGTVELTMIPEDRLGRIFRSILDGEVWEDTGFPNIAVTALKVNQLDPYTAWAGAYNPFYYVGGLYRLTQSGDWSKVNRTPGDTLFVRINCIEIDEDDTNQIFVRTDKGLFITRDGGQTWSQTLENLNISSVVIAYNWYGDWYRVRYVYAATRGQSYSDGIYRSYDKGKTWVITSHRINVVGLVRNPQMIDGLYMGVYGEGVFKSTDGGETWIEMNQGLTNRNVTALAVNWVDLGVVFAGTEEGVFTYVPSFIGIKGDVNNDGQIDVTDVLLLVNFILGFQEPTADQFWAADYNNDNALNVLDVVLLVNEILG